MRSQPPIRLLQFAVICCAVLALLAFYVALSVPAAGSHSARDLPTARPGLTLVSPPTSTTVIPRAAIPTLATGISFTVIDEGEALALASTAPTIGQALAQAGVVLYLADRVLPPADSLLTPGLTVTIDRSIPVTITVDGTTLRTRASPNSRTVAEALAEAGIALQGQDYTLPSAGDLIPAGGTIAVTRVIEQQITQTEPVPYETLYEARADWEIDTVQVAQPGQEGVLERTINVRYENGAEVSRQVVAETVTQPPVNHVIGYGVNIVIRTLDTADGPVEYWRKIFVRITSYSPSRSGTSPEAAWYGRTRTGKPLVKGLAAVDPTVIPLGTKFYVVGYGHVSAEDTGSKIQGKWVDLGYEDANFEHWHGYTDVYLLTPVPPAEQINWLLP